MYSMTPTSKLAAEIEKSIPQHRAHSRTPGTNSSFDTPGSICRHLKWRTRSSWFASWAQSWWQGKAAKPASHCSAIDLQINNRDAWLISKRPGKRNSRILWKVLQHAYGLLEEKQYTFEDVCTWETTGTDQIESGYPKVCRADERQESEPEKPGVQLRVPSNCSPQQRRQGFAEQHRLGANGTTEQRKCHWKQFHPLIVYGLPSHPPASA